MAALRLQRGVGAAAAAIEQCRGSLSDAACRASLNSSLGSAVKAQRHTGAPTAQQQERLAAALLALLQALADERHPGDDAWQTAVVAACFLVDSGLADERLLQRELGSSAGRHALQAVVRRLHDCHGGEGPPLSAHGVMAIIMTARVVWAAWGAPGFAAQPAVDAAASPALPLMLLALVQDLLAPPAAPRHRTACACARPRRATAADAADVLLTCGEGAGLDVYGHSIRCHGRDVAMKAVVSVSFLCHHVVHARLTTLRPLVWAQWRSLCSMLLALEVDGKRRSGRAGLLDGAAAADLARFVNPRFLVGACAGGAGAADGGSWRTSREAAAALDPQHAPLCAACLPEQLMLLLEVAALADDPAEAAQGYTALANAWVPLRNLRGDAAGPLRGFWCRAWPHLAARALEAASAAGQAPEGSAAASHHVTLLAVLAHVLFFCTVAGCAADEGAALDAICEAAARARPPLMLHPACVIFSGRLHSAVDGLTATGGQRQGDGSLPVALTAAGSSMGKLLQASPDFGHVFDTVCECWVNAVDACMPEDDAGIPAQPGGACGASLAAGGGREDAAEVAGAAAATNSNRQGRHAIARAAPDAERGGAQPRVQLLVLVAARVQGAAAQRWLLADGEAALTAKQRELVTRTAAQLQRPPLWSAVQRATHGRITPLDTGGGVSACTAALRLLADLHDWLDPHALGVRLPGCYNPRCTNMRGASETGLPVRICSACRVARYCSAACSKQHWHCHKMACRLAASGAQQP